jgi:hypothetical protein
MHDKWGRRAKRHMTKNREDFEALARRVVKQRETAVDLGSVVFEVRWNRSRWKGWMEIQAPHGGTRISLHKFRGDKLVQAVADYLIVAAAEYPGVQIPVPQRKGGPNRR